MPRDEETSLYGTPPVEDTLVLRAGEPRGHSPKPLDLRQALAAFRATGRENLASALRRLAGAIADFPFPLDLRGLPCHLHDLFFLSTEMSGYFTIFTPRLSSA